MTSISGQPEPLDFNPLGDQITGKGQETSALAQKTGKLRNDVMESKQDITASCGNNKNTFIDPELMTDNPKINEQLAHVSTAVVVNHLKNALGQLKNFQKGT